MHKERCKCAREDTNAQRQFEETVKERCMQRQLEETAKERCTQGQFKEIAKRDEY